MYSNILGTYDRTPAAGNDERTNFTVNLAPGVLDVPCNALIPPSTGILCDPGLALYKIQPKDNFTLESIGVCLPYSFVLSTGFFSISLFWTDGVNPPGAIQEIGVGANFCIPMSNYECPLNVYVPWPSAFALPIWLYMTMGFVIPRVSMIGVPAAFAAAVLPVGFFLKVNTNIQLG